MADSLATLQTRRDALAAKIASGVQSLREGDKSVVHNRASEMKSTLADLDLQIAALIGTKRTLRVYPQTKKGF